MKLPSLEEFSASEEQRDVLEIPLDHHVFVVGPPGSGKTALALKRAMLVAEQKRPVKIVTYNRMFRRLIQLHSREIEASTMHAFVAEDYWSRTEGLSVPHHSTSKYRYRWDIIHQVLDSLSNPGTQLSLLIVDEAQDLELEFFRYSARIVRTLNIFSDTEQAVTQRFTSYQQIIDATGLPDPLILSENYRNCPEIAEVAEHYHFGELPMATVHRPKSGVKPRLRHITSAPDVSQLISRWFVNHGGSIGVIVKRNSYGEDVERCLRKDLPGERVDRYASGGMQDRNIELLEPGITIINQQSAKGQEFDSVFILEIEKFLPCETALEKRVMYMMCSRARDYLFLVHGPNALSAAAEASLPDPGVLERI